MRAWHRIEASFLLALGTLAAGCSTGPSEASSLQRARALGARVEVVGDPASSVPHPGEQAEVRWLLRGPAGQTEVDYVMRPCRAPARGAGLPVCEKALGEPSRGRGVEPSLLLEVPAELEGLDTQGAPTPLLVLAAFCTEGRAQIDPDSLLARCDDSGVLPEAATLYVDVAGENANPDVQDGAELWIAGEKWPADGSDGCAGPTLSSSEPSEVRVRLPAAARESTPEGPEELLVSHFATGGAFERLFSVIERDAETLQVRVSWDPQAAEPAGGEAHFVFVVRDQRGGMDWIERCAVVEDR